MRVGFSDIHPTLYFVSPWWNRLDFVLFGPWRTDLGLPWTTYRAGWLSEYATVMLKKRISGRGWSWKHKKLNGYFVVSDLSHHPRLQDDDQETYSPWTWFKISKDPVVSVPWWESAFCIRPDRFSFSLRRPELGPLFGGGGPSEDTRPTDRGLLIS